MSRIALFCTGFAMFAIVACSSPSDEDESSSEDLSELRAAPPVSFDLGGDTSRGATASPVLDVRLTQPGKPQPQPWRSPDPLPTDPQPGPSSEQPNTGAK